MNSGKRFEQNFKKSVPDNIFYYRLRDGTGNFAGKRNDNVRFQMYNICDSILHNGHTLYLLELKSHKDKSIPFDCFREKQIDGLLDANRYYGVSAEVVFDFPDADYTGYVNIDLVAGYMAYPPMHNGKPRKSIPCQWVKDYGTELKRTKMRTNYRYDLTPLVRW